MRTIISLILGLTIGCALFLGETKWTLSPFIEEWFMLVACVMASVGALGRIWCSLYIAGYKNNVLVMEGPYSMTRSPLYFLSFIGGAGVACATETFTIPLLITLAFLSYYPSIIKREQRRLEEIFGDEYREYVKRVPSFFPSFKLFKPEPTSYTVTPKVFTHNILDALWFVWLIGIFEFVGGLHESNILPVLFHLF